MLRSRFFGSLLVLVLTALSNGPVCAQNWIWSRYLTNQEVNSSPAVGEDGYSYVGCGNYLYCVAHNGWLQYSFDAGGRVDSSPALSNDGKQVYFGANNGKFYAIDAVNGYKLWDYTCPGQVTSSPAVGHDGTVYFTDSYNKLYAFSPGGAKKWELPNIGDNMAIDKDGTIYCGNSAIKPDGTVKWVFQSWGFPRDPIIGKDGTIYLATSVGKLFAVNPADHSQKWVFNFPNTITSAPALSPGGGLIYIACQDRNLYAIDTIDGKKQWTYNTNNYIYSSPAVAQDGNIYFCSNKPALHAIDALGHEEWVYDFMYTRAHSSPAIITHSEGKGAIIVGGWGHLYKIECDKPLATVSNWPMFRQNPKHNGRLGAAWNPLIAFTLLLLQYND